MNISTVLLSAVIISQCQMQQPSRWKCCQRNTNKKRFLTKRFVFLKTKKNINNFIDEKPLLLFLTQFSSELTLKESKSN